MINLFAGVAIGVVICYVVIPFAVLAMDNFKHERALKGLTRLADSTALRATALARPAPEPDAAEYAAHMTSFVLRPGESEPHRLATLDLAGRVQSETPELAAAIRRRWAR